jgi:hypothetical protein
MKNPNQDEHLQGVRDLPPGTPAERKEMEKLETQLGSYEIKARKVNDEESASQAAPPKGWVETSSK